MRLGDSKSTSSWHQFAQVGDSKSFCLFAKLQYDLTHATLAYRVGNMRITLAMNFTRLSLGDSRRAKRVSISRQLYYNINNSVQMVMRDAALRVVDAPKAPCDTWFRREA